MPRQSIEDLRSSLRRTKILVDKQIGEVENTCDEMGIQPEQLRHPDGSFVMVPLISARAQTLHALTLLQTER